MSEEKSKRKRVIGSDESENEPEIQTLKEMFPDLEEDLLKTLFEENKEIQATVDFIVSNVATQSKTSPKKAKQASSEEDASYALGKRGSNWILILSIATTVRS